MTAFSAGMVVFFARHDIFFKVGMAVFRLGMAANFTVLCLISCVVILNLIQNLMPQSLNIGLRLV